MKPANPEFFSFLYSGRTALHWAVLGGQVHSVKALLRSNASTGVVDREVICCISSERTTPRLFFWGTLDYES